MFTGIVIGIGTIISPTPSKNGLEYTVNTNIDLSQIKIGDSVSIDGACHSVTEKTHNSFKVFSSQETLTKTIISTYKPDTIVNLEFPLRAGDFIGGHHVTGHIDCIGVTEEIIQDDNGKIIKIKIPQEFTKYVVYKGSIAINGVSLTVNKVNENIIELYVIPITLEKTNLGGLVEGSKINVEVDITAKHIEKLLAGHIKAD